MALIELPLLRTHKSQVLTNWLSIYEVILLIFESFCRHLVLITLETPKQTHPAGVCQTTAFVCSNNTSLMETAVHFNQITDDSKLIRDLEQIFEKKPELKANIHNNVQNILSLLWENYQYLTASPSWGKTCESLCGRSHFEWHLPAFQRELNHILEAVISENEFSFFISH